MGLHEIAATMGVRSSELEELLSGEVPHSVAQRLSTRSSTVQQFVDGRADIGMAQALGTTVTTAQSLRERIGRDGAIGLVIGVCVGVGMGHRMPR